MQPTYRRPTTQAELEANIARSPLSGNFIHKWKNVPTREAHMMYSREVIKCVGEVNNNFMPWPDMRATLVMAEATNPIE